jgi:hypothetical protein
LEPLGASSISKGTLEEAEFSQRSFSGRENLRTT